MKKFRLSILLPIIGGILLIAAGVIFLLNNLGLIALDWEMLIGPLFAVGGLVFLIVFMMNTKDWWALIPGFVLVALGIIIFMNANLAGDVDRFSGAIFLGEYSPVALGDYTAGPSHVLPTGGSARFFSSLSVRDFVKETHIINYTKKAIGEEAVALERVAMLEGMVKHLESVKKRLT